MVVFLFCIYMYKVLVIKYNRVFFFFEKVLLKELFIKEMLLKRLLIDFLEIFKDFRECLEVF